MRVGVIGISYKTADLSVREEIVKKLALSLCQFPFPVVFLSTCNRTEIYYSGSDLLEKQKELLGFLKLHLGSSLVEKMFSLLGKQAFLHLCRVASGIDSAVLGETEIQKQVKNAYLSATSSHLLPSALHFLFQKSFKVAKALRNKFLLMKGLPSLKETLWESVESNLDNPGSLSFLFIGFSQINRQILPFFLQKGCKKLALSSRQKEGEEYAKKLGCEFLPWTHFTNFSGFDGVISASHAEGYLIQEDIRREKPLIIFDLSMPRNAHPGVASSPHVSLYNLQMLDALLQTKRERFRKALFLCEKMLEEEVDKLWEIYQAKTSKNSLLKLHMPRIPWKRDDVADILHPCYEENKPFKAYPESAVGYGAILS